MASATINTTAWAGVNASPCKTELKARPYSLARAGGALLAAELALLAVAALETAWYRQTLGTLILIASCALFFHINNLDRSLVNPDASQFWIDLLESVSLGFLASALIFHMFPAVIPHAGSALSAALLMGLLPVGLRLSLRNLVTHGKCVEDILIVGTGELAASLYRALGRGATWSKRAQQMVSLSESLVDRGVAVDFEELNELVLKSRISRVVIAELDTHSREKLAAALLDSRLRGLPVCDAVDFYETFSGKIWLEALNPQWFVYTNGFKRSLTGICLKRCFDVAFALGLILLAAPLQVLIAIAIKLDSAGPVLFRQVRAGLHGKEFVIYKFRSMRHDAELTAGPKWAAEKDERVTKVGRLLRMFRLDEIPQAFNVLKGDMSIVGPRPERPCFVDRLKREIPYYDLRHYLKPGITGWAQVMYRYGASVEDAYEKLQYDLFYVKHWSFRCDLGILLRTIRIVLFGRGR